MNIVVSNFVDIKCQYTNAVENWNKYKHSIEGKYKSKAMKILNLDLSYTYFDIRVPGSGRVSHFQVLNSKINNHK